MSLKNADILEVRSTKKIRLNECNIFIETSTHNTNSDVKIHKFYVYLCVGLNIVKNKNGSIDGNSNQTTHRIKFELHHYYP